MRTLVPFRDFAWGDDMSMKEITCVNHPTARYLSRNPAMRGLHFIQAAEGFGYAEECPCPYEDLRVVVEVAADQVAVLSTN